MAGAATAPVSSGVDMYAMPYQAPARIATDSAGRIFVTDPLHNAVYILSNNGSLLEGITDIPNPLGIAASSGGDVFVSDSRGGSVGAYRNGVLQFKLGSGDREFQLANDMSIASNGNIYVADSKAGVVKVYASSEGNYVSTFGAGLLRYPSAIAIDDAAGEIFVLSYGNLTVYVYDLQGTLKRSIKGGSSGMLGGGCGNLCSPLGLAVDSSRLYVSDSYHSVIATFDKAAGTFLANIGNYGSGLKEFRTPTDLVIDKDSKMFVTNTNNQRIEVIGLDVYTGIRIDPESVTFSAYAGGYPVTQSVNLTSVGSDISWTGSTTASWLLLSSQAGATPASVTISVDPAFLPSGVYQEKITFKTPSGTESVLPVTVNVVEPQKIFTVTPLTIDLIYQKGASAFPSGTVMLKSSDIPLSWTALTKDAWLSVDKISGVTPDTLRVAVKSIPTKTVYGRIGPMTVPLDSAKGSVTINAAGAQGSPVSVEVNFRAISAGNIKVSTNLDEAAFTITGPQNLTGGGKDWTAENVKPGTYSIAFSSVPGYISPRSRNFTVVSGKVSEIAVTYGQKNAASHIIASSGDPAGNMVSVISLTGASGYTITPFATSTGVRAIAADLDGDGVDEIVVSNTVNMIKVYGAAGDLLSSVTLPAGSRGLGIAAADIDADGVQEIIAGYRMYLYRGVSAGQVVAFKMAGTSLTLSRQIMTLTGDTPFTVAAGDLNGDGVDEVIISKATSLSTFRITTVGTSLMWSKSFSMPVPANIATGDINNDGHDEILAGQGPYSGSGTVVQIYNGDGSDFGVDVDAFGDYGYRYGVSVGTGDVDGDGRDELIAGAGPGASNEALVRLFDGSGQLLSTIKVFDGFLGANAVLGRLTR